MPIPPVLRRLLTAPGPSGYETAPAAVWREAAARVRRGGDRRHGLARPRGSRAPRGGPPLAVVGHIDEIGLIVTHIDDEGFLWFAGVGGWDPQILVGQRVELATRDGAGPRRRRQEADPPAQGRRAQEGRRAEGACTSTSAPPTATRRARVVRIGDVAVIAAEPVELPQRPRRLALDGQPPRLLRRLEAARLVAEAGGAPGDVVAGRRRAGGDDVRRRRARPRSRCEPDLAIVVDVTHATDAPGHRREGARQPPARLRPGDRARLDAPPARLRAAARDRRGGGDPVHGRGRPGAAPAPTPTRSRSRAPASRPASSRSRCATCTRRSRWSQLDDVENAARLIAAFARRSSRRTCRSSAAARARCCSCSTSTARSCSGAGRRARAGAARGDRARSMERRPPRRYGVETRRAHRRRRSRGDLVAGGVDARVVEGALAEVQDAPGRRVRARSCPPTSPTGWRPASSRFSSCSPTDRERCRLSLVTGNVEAIARLQARAARASAHHFDAGPGRASAPTRRTARLPPAIARARAGRARHGDAPGRASARVVIGDTPRDIACARADGVRVVAVATGPFGVEHLADADALLGSLRDLPDALAALSRA